MSFHDRYIATQIEENWESFPYKLDYIMYVVYSNNFHPSDIRFKNENGLYSVEIISDRKDNIDYKRYALKEEYLFTYLNSILPLEDRDLDFAYKTQIFTPPAVFRCNAQKNYLSLRLINTNVPDLSSGKLIRLTNADCLHFNDKVNNYSLFVDLNEKLPQKPLIEKKRKI